MYFKKKKKRKGKIDMNNENGKLSLAEKMKEKADKMNEHPIVLSGNENEIANWCYEGIIKEVDKVAGYGCYNLRLWPLIPKEIREKIELNPSKPKSLITVKGLGYKINVESRLQ